MDHDAQDAPPPAAETAPPPAAAADAGGGRAAGEFERYALVAALTLVVLCLLIWDRWHGDPAPLAAPRPDRTLRVRIGGDAPPQSGASPDVRRASSDVPREVKPAVPPAPPVPVPPRERTYTVKDGDTLGAIAARELGSASRASEIAALNGIDDPALIRKGAVLKLPPK
jgi:nucleoid-associated protein YgaU